MAGADEKPKSRIRWGWALAYGLLSLVQIAVGELAAWCKRKMTEETTQ